MYDEKKSMLKITTKIMRKLELVFLPKGKTVYIPEWFAGWPL